MDNIQYDNKQDSGTGRKMLKALIVALKYNSFCFR